MVFGFLFFYSAIGLAEDWPYIEVYRLDTGENLTSELLDIGQHGIRLEITEYQFVALKFIAFLGNGSSKNYFGKMETAWRSVHPNLIDYVEGWKDIGQVVPPGGSTIEQIVTIHPSSRAQDSVFTVWAVLYMGESPADPGYNTWKVYDYKVIINVKELDESTFKLPILYPDYSRFSDNVLNTRYSRGVTNVISWLPAEQSGSVRRIVQDVYCFDTEDRANLISSIRRLYKSGQSENLKTAFFDGLKDGHTYGYFAKSVYETDKKTLTLCTDVVYSTQDNTPPEKIVEPQAAVRGEIDEVLLWWKSVTDDLSGVLGYRIYRAVDEGVEILKDSVMVGVGQESYYSWNDYIETGHGYTYRVRAVDRIGNEGDGDRSNRVSLNDGDVTVAPTDDDTDDGSGPSGGSVDSFHKGPMDTLWINLYGWEEQVRFMAVRDDTSFFSNPPNVGMRYFDSGWISPNTLQRHPINRNRRYWIFNYATHEAEGVVIDLNFVDHHTYHRRILRRSNSGIVQTDRLPVIVPDCFPPEDVFNLKTDAVVDDVNFQNPISGYTRWHLALSWKPAVDRGSGLKRYRIFRRVDGIDTDFLERPLLPDNFLKTSFTDSCNDFAGNIFNPVVKYRIVSEDNAGNRRDFMNTDWEAEQRALWAPALTVADEASPNIHQAGSDTTFVKGNAIRFRIDRFDLTDVKQVVFSVNGREVVFDKQGDTYTVPLDTAEVSWIKARVLYRMNQSSLWSSNKIIIREVNRAPLNLEVWNDPNYWRGNIHLQWLRPTLDAVDYEVWRWNESGDSSLVGIVQSKEDTVRWTDFYGFDERYGEPGDRLVAYEKYTYKVRKLNVFDSKSTFSDSGQAVCNRPPRIVGHEIRNDNGADVIIIQWERARPTRASGWWRTRVRVSMNTLDNIIYLTDAAHDVVDDTSFTMKEGTVGAYRVEISAGHNYIFEIKEFPEFPLNAESSWSQPYTVNMTNLDSLFVLPQPRGQVFISWDEDTLIDRLPVNLFEVCRIRNSDSLFWTVPGNVTSTMDAGQGLEHGQRYEYRVSALDSLGQVLAQNSQSAICDTGAAFIPEIDPFTMGYFNSGSLLISWMWRDFAGTPLDSTTEGAVMLRIEISVSRMFPSAGELTETTGWFRADPMHRTMNVKIPNAVNADNRTVYCRITAMDRWNHPTPLLWSTDFYRMKKVVYDPFFPLPVKDLLLSSAEAYYRNPDTVAVNLRWSEEGVTTPPDGNVYWNALVANVASYRILHEFSLKVDTVAVVPSGGQYYTFSDIVRNTPHRWRVVTVDSAGNETQSAWIGRDLWVKTPDPPVPTGFKSCSIRPVPNDTNRVEYYVEIAMDRRHFRWAYEMDGGVVDRLLCGSGWMTDLTFACTTGWGAIVADTTWFRVKARVGLLWESGWSSAVFFSRRQNGDQEGKQTGIEEDIPAEFEVHQNYPNPFNAETRVSYQLPQQSFVEIRVYNVAGSLVDVLVEEEKAPGSYTVVWDGRDRLGRNAASGIYLCHLVAKTNRGDVFQKRFKMMMIK